jgi:hypothetical protein
MTRRPARGGSELSFNELTRQPLGLVRCLKCGVEETFETTADAHGANWDVAPYFTFQVLCPNCPTGGAWAKEYFLS